MNDERFVELIRTMRVFELTNPRSFSVERFVRSGDLSPEQVSLIEKEFNRKKPWMDNSMFYGYFENDYF